MHGGMHLSAQSLFLHARRDAPLCAEWLSLCTEGCTSLRRVALPQCTPCGIYRHAFPQCTPCGICRHAGEGLLRRVVSGMHSRTGSSRNPWIKYPFHCWSVIAAQRTVGQKCQNCSESVKKVRNRPIRSRESSRPSVLRLPGLSLRVFFPFLAGNEQK